MKYKHALKKRCNYCKIIKRFKYLINICTKYNKHKQRQR